MFLQARINVRDLLVSCKAAYYSNKINKCNGNQKAIFNVVSNVLHRKQDILHDSFDSQLEMVLLTENPDNKGSVWYSCSRTKWIYSLLPISDEQFQAAFWNRRDETNREVAQCFLWLGPSPNMADQGLRWCTYHAHCKYCEFVTIY